MSDLYLVAHLVRSEPAFDIASQIEVEGEVWWIIPTSGHRAWPYAWVELAKFRGIFEWGERSPITMHACLTHVPANWPDHYTAPAAKGTGKITNLASLLGIGKREEVKRRV